MGTENELDASFGDNEESAIPEPEITLGNQFLSNIPEQDRGIVERYVKDWDGQVTKKFQSIHDQYKPYKELGAKPEDLQKAWALVQKINADPEEIFRTMYLALRKQHGDDFNSKVFQIQQAQAQAMSDQGLDFNGQQEFEQTETDFDPAQHPAFQQMSQELAEMRQWRETQQQAELQAREDAALDQILNILHTKHGEFDDAWVISQLSAGKDPDKAVESYNELVERVVNSHKSPPPPKILGGQGGVPSGQVDTAGLDSKGRKTLIEQYLAAKLGEG